MASYGEYNAQNLRNRVDVYAYLPEKNEYTGKVEYKYRRVKKGVYASVRLVRRKLREGEADTKYGIITHEILMRRKSVPELDETYRFYYKDSYMKEPIIMKILSIDYDFNRTGMIYCRCEQVIE